jgi:hypothetical protein
MQKLRNKSTRDETTPGSRSLLNKSSHNQRRKMAESKDMIDAEIATGTKRSLEGRHLQM